MVTSSLEMHPPGHRPQAGVGAGQWCSGGVYAQPPQLLHQVLQQLVNWWAGSLFQGMAPYMSGTWVGAAKAELLCRADEAAVLEPGIHGHGAVHAELVT